jgi:hypothetical protein
MFCPNSLLTELKWVGVKSHHAPRAPGFYVTASLGRSYALHASAFSTETADGARAPTPEGPLLQLCLEGALRQARQTAAQSVATNSLVIINKLPARTDKQQCNCQYPMPTEQLQGSVQAKERVLPLTKVMSDKGSLPADILCLYAKILGAGGYRS